MIGRSTPAYRFVVFGEPRGPWRETRDEAGLDAMDAGLGSRDDHTELIWVTVPGDIAVTWRDVPTWPRSRVEKGLTYNPPRTGIERISARREARKSAGPANWDPDRATGTHRVPVRSAPDRPPPRRQGRTNGSESRLRGR